MGLTKPEINRLLRAISHIPGVEDVATFNNLENVIGLRVASGKKSEVKQYFFSRYSATANRWNTSVWFCTMFIPRDGRMEESKFTVNVQESQ